MRAIVLTNLLVTVGVVACSSSKAPGNSGVDANGSGSGSGSGVIVDAGDESDGPTVRPDSPVISGPRPLYALSNTELYAIDVDALTSTPLGTVTVGGLAVDGIDGLGFDGTSLIALDTGAVDVLVIDPATTTVLASKPLSQGGLFGLTVIPAADSPTHANLYLAASGSTLYRITPSTGQVDVVGTFSSSMTFHTDLAWVHGKGLFITLDSLLPDPTTNSTTALVKIDPSTAATVQVVRWGFENVTGLSGYRGAIWAVTNGGNVYTFDGTGTLQEKLMNGPEYSEAAE